ncbi:MAG: DUF3467 domain-containing protein [Phycisphaeraceae bacterium]|nr:DUF3467 domain-containing protein [Phycisphaerales bacterium]MCA9307600.1 DUF3467 domain-containing protein [Phycisphaerales bacterium]MCB9843188.1 DUF3467 domain-containing protein [Phycisphaeraceae bacterium]
MSAQEQQVHIRIDETKMATAYANTIRSGTTSDELILDFGVNLPVQSGAKQGEPMQMVFSVGSRVIMNWSTAKRLLGSIHQAVAAYEKAYGTIDLEGPKPVART